MKGTHVLKDSHTRYLDLIDTTINQFKSFYKGVCYVFVFIPAGIFRFALVLALIQWVLGLMNLEWPS